MEPVAGYTSEQQRAIAQVKQEVGQIITLRAVFGKQQSYCDLVPPLGLLSGKLIGVQELSPEDERKAKRAVTKHTTRRVTDGMTLNLANEVDATDWQWLKACPEIAGSLDESQMSPQALFYVENMVKEVSDRVSLRKIKAEAVALVYNLSSVERKQLIRQLGQSVDDWREDDIIDFITDKAETHPQQVLDKYRNDDFKLYAFVFQLVDRGVFKRRDGIFYYGEIYIGRDETSILAWIKNPANQDIVQNLYLDVNPLPKTREQRHLESGFNPIADIEKQRAELEAQALADAAGLSDASQFAGSTPPPSFTPLVENPEGNAQTPPANKKK